MIKKDLLACQRFLKKLKGKKVNKKMYAEIRNAILSGIHEEQYDSFEKTLLTMLKKASYEIFAEDKFVLDKTRVQIIKALIVRECLVEDKLTCKAFKWLKKKAAADQSDEPER